jgi:hypothetical protein
MQLQTIRELIRNQNNEQSQGFTFWLIIFSMAVKVWK